MNGNKALENSAKVPRFIENYYYFSLENHKTTASVI